MAFSRERIGKIKGALLMIGILVLGGVLLMFAFHGQRTTSDQTGITAENKYATFAIGGIHHTDIKEGAKDLELSAESANLHMDDDRAELSMLQATFFEKNGDSVILSAESGTWEMDSNDLEVSGNVMLKTNQYEMRTETLTYTDSGGMFATQSQVTIQGVSLNMTAEGMSYSLDSERIHLDGNVESEFGNDIGF